MRQMSPEYNNGKDKFDIRLSTDELVALHEAVKGMAAEFKSPLARSIRKIASAKAQNDARLGVIPEGVTR